MTCIYCGREIRWTETQGWNVVENDRVIHFTFECDKRDNPAHGHALEVVR